MSIPFNNGMQLRISTASTLTRPPGVRGKYLVWLRTSRLLNDTRLFSKNVSEPLFLNSVSRDTWCFIFRACGTSVFIIITIDFDFV